MIARPISAALAAVALLAGCGMLPHAPEPEIDQGAWPEARDRATRFADLYDGFEHRASLWAVRLTREVREERARRVAQWLSWTQAELDAKLAEERAEAAKWDDFVLFLYTEDRKWNDLDAPESIWRVEYDVGGGEAVAPRATAIGRTATFDQLFPMGGPFDTAYLLRFPLAAEGTAPLPGFLRVSSALGEMLLTYTPGSQPTPAPRKVE
ncbi:MAG TPA: hypothetical protein VLT47_08000 [Anaeromyxobacteraceae bacterium]|nr:hypothetical protein [Anaeromyxobacteraceae bacterium]